MFHNRTMNNKINRLHERVYNDECLSFQELLDKDHRNLQQLAIEMYRAKHKLFELFEEQHHTHDLRNKRHWDGVS